LQIIVLAIVGVAIIEEEAEISERAAKVQMATFVNSG
jgi:hypothetical protein